ncbi:MAG TPA: DUF4190 domain-containing protein [Anaerolineae bacterium]|nr:DUF4190 domain-containing protein [Anaerolineae bacterium]
MFCPQCGAHNEDEAIYCGECGAVLDADAAALARQYPTDDKVPETPILVEEMDDVLEVEAVPPPPRRPSPAPVPARPAAAGPTTSGLAIASLLLGIGGLTLLPLLGSIVAIVLGYMARNDIRRRPGEVEGDGLALAGIVLGWIAVGLTLLGLILGTGFLICGLCAGFGAEW